MLVFFVLFERKDTRKVCNVKQIGEWLESKGQDYAQGVALYAAHGKSRVVLKSLQYGCTEFTRATLRRELEKLASTGGARVNVVSSPRNVVSSPRNVVGSPRNVVSSPEKVESSDEQRHQRSSWYAERNRLHAQLELVATDVERRLMAERILVLADLLATSYAESTPVAAPRADLAAVAREGEIRRLLANLRPQASKLKKKPERAADLVQVLADINLLETKLKQSHE